MDTCYLAVRAFHKIDPLTPIGTSQPPCTCSWNSLNFKKLMCRSIEKVTLIPNLQEFLRSDQRFSRYKWKRERIFAHYYYDIRKRDRLRITVPMCVRSVHSTLCRAFVLTTLLYVARFVVSMCMCVSGIQWHNTTFYRSRVNLADFPRTVHQSTWWRRQHDARTLSRALIYHTNTT